MEVALPAEGTGNQRGGRENSQVVTGVKTGSTDTGQNKDETDRQEKRVLEQVLRHVGPP